MDPEQEKREQLVTARDDQLRAAEQCLTFLRETNQLIRRMDCFASQGQYGIAKDWLYKAVDALGEETSEHCRSARWGGPDGIPL